MIQIQLQHPPVVFEFSHPHPHPQFVAAKSLISYSSEIIFTMYLMRKRLEGEEIIEKFYLSDLFFMAVRMCQKSATGSWFRNPILGWDRNRMDFERHRAKKAFLIHARKDSVFYNAAVPIQPEARCFLRSVRKQRWNR